MKCRRLRNRDRYLEEAMLFRDTDLIKVITGVRRCGKPSLLDLIRMTIESEGVAGRGFVSVNLESKGTGIKTEDQLYDYVRGLLSDKGCTYVFIDEPQRIEGWQDAVNAMRVDFDCDIYLTDSNAYLLSSELATYLSGRYVEVKMLPLSFSEFADFCGIEFVSGRSVALTPEGTPFSSTTCLLVTLSTGACQPLHLSRRPRRSTRRTCPASTKPSPCAISSTASAGRAKAR